MLLKTEGEPGSCESNSNLVKQEPMFFELLRHCPASLLSLPGPPLARM